MWLWFWCWSAAARRGGGGRKTGGRSCDDADPNLDRRQRLVDSEWMASTPKFNRILRATCHLRRGHPTHTHGEQCNRMVCEGNQHTTNSRLERCARSHDVGRARGLQRRNSSGGGRAWLNYSTLSPSFSRPGVSSRLRWWPAGCWLVSWGGGCPCTSRGGGKRAANRPDVDRGAPDSLFLGKVQKLRSRLRCRYRTGGILAENPIPSSRHPIVGPIEERLGEEASDGGDRPDATQRAKDEKDGGGF